MIAPRPDWDVLVLGAGPAGCTAAAALAREGRSVLVLDRGDTLPPFGQALRPGVIPILDAIGAFEAVKSAGFQRKTGSTHWGWGQTEEWDLWFADSEMYDYAWFVDRPRFDEILLENARKAGAEVALGAVIKRLVWEGDRLVGAAFEQAGEPAEEVRARFVIDASGKARLVGRELSLYEPLSGLQHQALFAHYEGVLGLAPPRHEQALFLADDRHWFWVFPMAHGRTSVGIVLLDDEQGADERFRTSEFDARVAGSERLAGVLGPDAKRVTAVQRRRDWSYRLSRVSGPGWFLVGDAGGFIDPVLAQGVVMALNTGYVVSQAILSVLRGETTEAKATEQYQVEHKQHFGDLVEMLRFFYCWDVSREDYFWESKRILSRSKVRLRPQKAFAFLTSGLVRNLALDEKSRQNDRRRERAIAETDASLPSEGAEAGGLGFIGVHLVYRHPRKAAPMYLLIEPTDPTAPALFRTRSFDINVMSHVFKDPVRDPLVGRVLKALVAQVGQWDHVAEESLADFWLRTRGPFMQLLGKFPPALEVKRVFGE